VVAAYGPDHPEVAGSLGTLGLAQMELGDSVGARATLERALTIVVAAYGPDHPEVAKFVDSLGLAQLHLGNPAEACTLLERALAITEAAYGPDHPGIAKILNRLGLAQLQLDDLANARTTFDRALAIEAAAGMLNTQHGRAAQALADLTRKIELNPGSADIFTGRGTVYLTMKLYDRALDDFTSAIELNPNSPEKFTDRGSAFMAMNRNDEAIADFSRAIELDPNYARAIAKRGELYLISQSFSKGIADLRRATELVPDLSAGLAKDFVPAAIDHLRAARADLAADIFHAVIAACPSSGLAHHNYAFCLLPIDAEAALRELTKARDLGYDNITAIANQVMALHLLRRDNEALALGNSRKVRKLPSSEASMWNIKVDHSLELGGLVELHSYLQSLLEHIKNEHS
jgi:tetratricopeptide (TPR) repeat protein